MIRIKLTESVDARNARLAKAALVSWTLPPCPVAHCYRNLPYDERMRVISTLTRHWSKMI